MGLIMNQCASVRSKSLMILCGFFSSILVLLTAACAENESEGAAKISLEYLHGDWCQRFSPPPDEEEAAPEEEVLNLTFRPGGAFLIGRVGSPLKEMGLWTLKDGRLQMTGNPVGGKPVWVSSDEFRFTAWTTVEVKVKRGHCKEE